MGGAEGRVHDLAVPLMVLACDHKRSNVQLSNMKAHPETKLFRGRP